MYYHENINKPNILKFGAKIQRGISNKITNLGLDLSEAPLQESVAMATAKDLHSNIYLSTNSYLFSGKVTKLG